MAQGIGEDVPAAGDQRVEQQEAGDASAAAPWSAESSPRNGSQPSSMAKRSCSMMANQKAATAMPSTEKTRSR